MPPWLQYTLPAAVLSRKCLFRLDPETSRVLTPLSTAYIITYLAFIQAHGHCERESGVDISTVQEQILRVLSCGVLKSY